jgi:hypothetical protein
MLYFALWLRIRISIVLESSEFSLQHLQKYLQSLAKNQVDYLGCTVGLLGGEGAFC